MIRSLIATMQIKNNNPNYLPKPRIIILIKLLLLVGCVFFLYTRLKDQSISFDELVLSPGFEWILLLVIPLMPINWYLEALRWKLSIDPFEPITMKEAWGSVLGGLALNWVLPFTSGDLLTRISQQRDKYQATAAVVLNRGIMLLITLAMGLYGVSFLARELDLNGWFLLGLIICVPILKVIFKKPIKRFIAYFQELKNPTLMRIIGISFLRYAIFLTQFYLLLNAFLPSLESQLLIAGIGWIFMVRSALPLLFGGMGVREASGIFFFEFYVNDLQLVIFPIFLIWIINILIPSLIGLWFVWKLKFPLAQKNMSTN